MKSFKMVHDIFLTERFFTEDDAPEWLTCSKAVKGSTSDSSWFWNDYVLQLAIGASIQTDFHVITRIE